ncbi:uncharacterized protein LOC111702318 [Eurytemora carolleeae]|uniref:uncharacterized protein LOC111702318 n=1 Tax=Eurytemora carolleeae TaxID=1294199 RepID=UPI000C773026|nr:uncharacterized protein LOC111702318 [Eurytemora carolleeae]|eukprot:XP_023329734.1 uncharacterized protein LOC111702318 [Eurytemora affinis]
MRELVFLVNVVVFFAVFVHSQAEENQGNHVVHRRETLKPAHGPLSGGPHHGGPHGGPNHGPHGVHPGKSGDHCIVKGSYCQCHYCRCEKGQLHCKDPEEHKKHGYGKRYCYGSMEGEHCHCDYCKCRHGYGHEGWAACY